MAWTPIGTPNWGTNTATVPTHSAGNMILVASFRDGNTTPPSLPGGVNLTNIFSTTGANSCSIRVAFKIATSSSETIGTFTNGTTTVCCVLENAAPGAFVRGQASNTTFNYPALTFLEGDGTSGAIGFIFSRDGSSPASVGTAPTGMTNWSSQGDATDCGGVHYDLTGTSWTSQNVATGVAATGWQSFILEILDQELPTTNYFGYNTIGATEAGPNVDTTQAGSRFIVPENCTINEVWVYAKHFDASGIGKTCIYSTDAGGSPIVPDVVLDNGSSFDFNQFWAWRKSTGYSYSAMLNEEIYPSAAFNDTWHMRYGSGATDQTYDKQNFAYASAFEDPSTNTDRSVANIQLSIIVKYIPSAGDISGSTSGVATTTGTLNGKGSILASVAGSAITSGAIRATVNISASVNGQSTVLGSISGEGLLVSSVSGISAISGVISAKGALISQTSGSATVSGSLLAKGHLTAVVSGIGSTSGVLQGRGLIYGSVQGTSTTSGILLSEGLMLGSTNGTSNTTGTLSGRASISGSTQGAATGTGNIIGFGRLIGFAQGVSSGTGTVAAQGELIGAASGSSSVAGILTINAGASNIYGSTAGVANVSGFLQNRIPKQSYAIDFAFVKQSHGVNFTSNRYQHTTNYTFVKTNIVVDSE